VEAAIAAEDTSALGVPEHNGWAFRRALLGRDADAFCAIARGNESVKAKH
jgi:hypothetical protein